MKVTRPKPPPVESAVRNLYERYPYPPRNPDDERNGLRFSYTDYLPLVNQTCFRGARDFQRDFRVLVAGSGTGDVEIFFGEQLHGYDCEIVALDLSHRSISVARQRAAVRGLRNIQWIRGSILDADRLKLGTFDYISSTGVLHHLDDPAAGLRALRAVLKDDGAMGLMVYGRHGRTAIHLLQQALARVNRRVSDPERRVELARRILQTLPETNWFARSQGLVTDHVELGDAGIADLLLHPCEHTYSVPELMAWLDACDMSFLDFSYHRRMYDPTEWIDDAALARMVGQRPRREQYAIAELLVGCLYAHYFYCAPAPAGDRRARVTDPGVVPFLWIDRHHDQLADQLAGVTEGACVTVRGPNGARCDLPRRPAWLPELYRRVDGRATVAEITAGVAKTSGVTSPDVLAVLEDQYRLLHGADLMVLRQARLAPYRSPAELELRLARS